MKSVFAYLVLLLSLTLPAPAGGQLPGLTYKLQPGESYFLQSDLQQSTHSESIDSEEISFYNLTRVEFYVDSIDQMDRFHMEARYRDLLISMLAPQMEIDISSASGKNGLLSEMVALLEQGTFSMVLTSRGELVELVGLEELFKTLETIRARDTSEFQVSLETLEEAYGPDAFKSFCNVFLWIYPVMNSMSNWTNDVTYFLNTKAVTLVNRYTLSRSSEDRILIQGMGMLNGLKEYYETTGMGEVKSTVSGSQTYDFHMDPKTGWLKRCVSRQRVIIETTILKSEYFPSGLKIPSYTETAFEVTGGRMEKQTEPDRK